MRRLVVVVAGLVLRLGLACADETPTSSKTLTPEQAKGMVHFDNTTWLAERGYDVVMIDITSLDSATAKELAKCQFVGLGLSSVTEIDQATALELSKAAVPIYLNGLTEINKATAAEFAKANHLWSLNGIKNLDDETASELAKCKKEVCLNGLVELTSRSLAEKLSRDAYEEHMGYLRLSHVKTLSPAAAEALAVDDIFLESLDLESLEDLPPDVAAGLAICSTGSLSLPGLKEISPAAAEQLGQSTARISLDLPKLASLSAGAAAGLAKFQKSLSLSGLKKINADAASALGEAHAEQLVLNGLKTIDEASAAGLSKYEGALYLDGLNSLNASTAENLAKFEGRSLSLGRYGGDREHLWISAVPKPIAVWEGRPTKSDVFGKFGQFQGQELFLALNNLDDDLAEALVQTDAHKLQINGLESLDDSAFSILEQNPSIEIEFSSFRTLTSMQAKGWHHWALGQDDQSRSWSLYGLKFLTDDAYATLRLSEYFSINPNGSGNGFSFENLHILTQKQARDFVAVSMLNNNTEIYTSLRSITPDVAKELSRFSGKGGKGGIGLDELESISDEALAILRENKALTLDIDFAEMKSITAKQGRELVNDANAEGEGIGFSNLEELSPEVAAELVKSPGSLYLSLSLPTVSAKTAVVLAQHQGGLDLTLQTLSLEAAFALAQHENELRIWLDKPTSSVVSALAKHQGQIDLGFEEAEVENLHEAFYEERERFLNEKRAAGSRNQK